MGRGVGAGVGKPPLNEPAGCWIERCGLWGFDGGCHRACVPMVGAAGTIIALFAAGERILAPCKPVAAAVWLRRVTAIGIWRERYRCRWRTSDEDRKLVGAGLIGPSHEVSMTIMRPPQDGQASAVVCAWLSSSLWSWVGCSGVAAPWSISRIRAMLSARPPLARNP